MNEHPAVSAVEHLLRTARVNQPEGKHVFKVLSIDRSKYDYYFVLLKVLHPVLVYKKVFTNAGGRGNQFVVTLVLHRGARLMMNTDRKQKFRASCAFVTMVPSNSKRGYASRGDFCYEQGTTVRPTQKFCTEPRICASGLHVFLTYQKAKWYGWN